MGNIMDPSLRQSITNGKNTFLPCSKGSCFEQCDGYKTVQDIPTTSGTVHHEGNDIASRQMQDKDFCILQIHLTAKCNWKCPYCCADGWMDKHADWNMSESAWENTTIFFTGLYETGFVLLLGGEPTVHPAWSAMTQTFLSAGWQVSLITNFSLTDRIFDMASRLTDAEKSKMLINVSLHPTQWKNGFNDIEKNMKKLKDVHQVPFAATVVTTEENMSLMHSLEIEPRLRNIGCEWIGHIKEI